MTGRTVEEAKDLALDRLGVDEGDAEFEVVEEPRPGLFGRVRGEARVRARVRPTQPRAKVERRDRRRRTSGSSRDEAGRDDASAQQQANAEDQVTDEPTQDAPDAAPKRAPRSADTGAIASEFLLGLAEAFGARATTTEVVDVGDGDLEVRLQGEDLGLLIGPRGQTLQAVQDLTACRRPAPGGGPSRSPPHRHRRVPGTPPRSAQPLHRAGRRRGRRQWAGPGARADVLGRPQGRPRRRLRRRRRDDPLRGRRAVPAGRHPAGGCLRAIATANC